MVGQFVAITDANASTVRSHQWFYHILLLANTVYQAQSVLASANWNLQEAITLFYAAQEEGQEQDNDDDYEYESTPQSSVPAQPTPATAPTSLPAARQPPTSRPKQMTMDELRKRNEEGDDDSEEDKPQDMFAGGEKSALAVHNPQPRRRWQRTTRSLPKHHEPSTSQPRQTQRCRRRRKRRPTSPKQCQLQRPRADSRRR